MTKGDLASWASLPGVTEGDEGGESAGAPMRIFLPCLLSEGALKAGAAFGFEDGGAVLHKVARKVVVALTQDARRGGRGAAARIGHGVTEGVKELGERRDGLVGMDVVYGGGSAMGKALEDDVKYCAEDGVVRILTEAAWVRGWAISQPRAEHANDRQAVRVYHDGQMSREGGDSMEDGKCLSSARGLFARDEGGSRVQYDLRCGVSADKSRSGNIFFRVIGPIGGKDEGSHRGGCRE